MATKEAMDKLRAVLDYIPEEAARRLPGDEQDYYDALTRRLSRTVAVKSVVRRRVIVEAPEPAEEGEEPVDAPRWEPPADEPEPAVGSAPEPEPAPEPQPEPEPEPVAAPAWQEGDSEAVTVVEAVGGQELEEPAGEPATIEPLAEDRAPPAEDEDFFEVTGKARDLEPVEPDVNLSEKEWRSLEPSTRLAEPEPAVEQAEPEPEPEAAAQDDAFEQVELPAEPPAEVAAAEGELEPAAATEFEVEEVEEEAAGVHPAVLAHLSRSEKHQPVDMLPGVGPAYAQRLRDAGVRNLVDLLQRDPDELAAQTYLPVEEIRRWHTVGQFQAIDGVGPAYADVLVRAGVQGLPDLAQQQPQPLAQRLKPFEGQGARATPDMLADWIHQAQRILEQSSAPGPASEFEIVEEEDAVVEEGAEPAYQVNEFTLYARESRRGGKARTTYFFSAEPVEDARPSPLPDGYEVLLNESTGVPVVRKSTARILPVRDIEGLGPVMAERLERAGIKTTKELRGIDVREVSGATGISERLLANYRSMAELLQVPTVQPEHASAMVYAGVRTIPDLLNATPTELAKQMHQAAKDFQLKLKQKVTAQKVRGWQERAKKL